MMVPSRRLRIFVKLVHIGIAFSRDMNPSGKNLHLGRICTFTVDFI